MEKNLTKFHEDQQIKAFAEDLEQYIKDSKTVLICLQKGNDLDTLASAMALAMWIEDNYGRKVWFVQVNVKKTILGDIKEWLPEYEEELGDATTLFITTDINDPTQILAPTRKIAERCLKTIKIDHHENSAPLGLYELLLNLPSFSSCSEIIWRIATILGWKKNKKVAEILFHGLYADSRCLLGSRVDGKTFLTIAEMYETGVPVPGVMRKLNSLTITELHMVAELIKHSYNIGGLLVLNLHPQLVFNYFPVNFRKRKRSPRIVQKKLLTFPLNAIESMVQANTIIYIHYCLFDPFSTDRRFVFVVLLKHNDKIEKLLEENGFKKQRNRYSREIKLSEIHKFIKDNEETLKE